MILLIFIEKDREGGDKERGREKGGGRVREKERDRQREQTETEKNRSSQSLISMSSKQPSTTVKHGVKDESSNQKPIGCKTCRTVNFDSAKRSVYMSRP